MPAHTYIRTGRYHDATLTNLAAGTADKAFLAVCHGSNGIYPLGYVPHNWHFATMTAGLTGSRTLALEAAAQTAQRVDRGMMATPPLEAMQLFLVAPLFTQVRFGEWDAILAQADAPAALPFPTAIWHFARGMAQVRKGALARRRTNSTHCAASPRIRRWRRSASSTSTTPTRLVASRCRCCAANCCARRAAAATASPRCATPLLPKTRSTTTNPPDWPLPMRPYLGAALLEAGDARGAKPPIARTLRPIRTTAGRCIGLAAGAAQARRHRRRRDDSAAAWSPRRGNGRTRRWSRRATDAPSGPAGWA